MTALFALATSLLWGLADFGGGLLTRRLPALTVVVVSQSAAAIMLAIAVTATGGWGQTDGRLWFAVAAGVVGPVAMLAFYRALALGPMGVVSPLASTNVIIPIGVGLLLGERPGAVEAAGIVIAALGAVLAGGPQLRGGQAVHREAVLLGVASAVGFGAVLALIAHASGAHGVLLSLLVQRVCNIAVGGAALAVAARRDPETYRLRHAWDRRLMPALVLVGVGDVVANGTYVLASHNGPVAVAAVLASLFPVVTAAAARIVLGERLRAVQAAGAGLAVAGTVLLAAH